jgi:hypothetical protein
MRRLNQVQVAFEILEMTSLVDVQARTIERAVALVPSADARVG